MAGAATTGTAIVLILTIVGVAWSLALALLDWGSKLYQQASAGGNLKYVED